MTTVIERDLRHTWMIIEVDEVYQETYQMRMLSFNSIPGFLDMQAQGLDEKSIYRYEISGKIDLKTYGEREGWKYVHMENFMKQFVHILGEVHNYLLDTNCLSLDPEHIYFEKDSFYFCYCPVLKQNLWEKFHELTEYFVRTTNYEEKEAVYFAYELHKASMEENYNIEEILEQILERKENEMDRVKVNVKEMTYEIEDDQILDEWAEEEKYQNKVVRDRPGMWGFVSKKLQKLDKKW